MFVRNGKAQREFGQRCKLFITCFSLFLQLFCQSSLLFLLRGCIGKDDTLVVDWSFAFALRLYSSLA